MADPAFRGFVETTLDALLIFEGCKRGLLPKISRRLQDFEKRELVVSGAVFVFDEEETGIKRWTDGLTWSPSRTLGNFLVYRELDKKAALQKIPVTTGGDGANGEDDEEGGSGGKSRLLGGLTSKADPVDDSSDPSRPGSSSAARRSLGDGGGGSQQLDRARERALVGSLTSSYRFRSDGLVKKTISLNGLHLIGYYRIEDVTSGRLRTPSSHPELVSIDVSSAFLAPALFRIPPIVEIGPDGSLRYKGEADAPLSPLTRSGSSQGFPTPGLSQSRPASSDSSFLPGMLPSPGGGWDYTPTVPAPGSPRRGAMSSFRASNRFDPYSSSRFSPTTANFPANAAYPFPAVPLNTPPPPRNAFSPVGESSLASTNDGYFQSRTPPVDGGAGMSVSAPMTEGWQGPQGAVYQPLPPPPSRGGVDAMPNSPSFYQPRRSIPYVPTTDTQCANTIFAYNPPPPPPAPNAPLTASQYAHYRAPSTATGSITPQFSAYQPVQAYNQHQQAALAQSHNQQRQYVSPLPHPPSTGGEASQSPFATPPATSHAARSVYPHPSQQPTHSRTTSSHNSPATHWAPPPPRSGGPIQEPTSSLAQQATSLMSEVSPHSPADAGGDSRMQRQQQAAMQAAYASAASYGRAQHAQQQQQGGWQAAQPQPQGEQAYPYIQRQHTPSGLVAAIANEEVVPASGHGLGVSAYGEIVPASTLPPQQRSSTTAYQQTSFRQSMPGQPSVSLSSQHAYAAPPPPNHFQQQRYDGGVSPLNQHLSGMLERDNERGGVNGGNAGWTSIKRETPGPVSPPVQHQEPPPRPPQSMPYAPPQYQHYPRPDQLPPPSNQPQNPQQQWWPNDPSWQHSLRPDGQ